MKIERNSEGFAITAESDEERRELRNLDLDLGETFTLTDKRPVKITFQKRYPILIQS